MSAAFVPQSRDYGEPRRTAIRYQRAESEIRCQSADVRAQRSGALECARSQPAFDLVGILFVKGVGNFAERMADNHAKFVSRRVGDALLEICSAHMKGGRQVPLHAEYRVAHEFQATPFGGGLGDIRR